MTNDPAEPLSPALMKELYEKPAKFGDSDTIRHRQYRVDTTNDLKTVTGHVVMTHSTLWIAGLGEVNSIICDERRPELEIIDQGTPFGSPFVFQPEPPHVPQPIPYNRRDRCYPGPMQVLRLRFGKRAYEMVVPAAASWFEKKYPKLDVFTDHRIYEWLRTGSPIKDRPEWKSVGRVGPMHVQRLKPLLRMLKDLVAELEKPSQQEAQP